MKKIVCLCLTAILALGLCISPASAAEPSPQYEIIDQWNKEGFIITEIKLGSSNGYDIHIYSHDRATDPGDSQRIGSYRFFVNHVGLNIYAVKGGTKIPLKEAYNQNLIDLNIAAKLVDGFRYGWTQYDVYPIGDVNQDKVLNMEDVVLLQRDIAKELSINYDSGDWKDFLYIYTVVDCNNDNKINLQDVLIMQKLIAKIPVVLP